MRVVAAYPPNFLDVVAAFPGARGRGVVFTWGGTLYNPDGGRVSSAIHAHEEVHHAQQGDAEAGIVEWWKSYLTDGAFRLAAEVPAHRAEYRAFCRGSVSGRERYLRAITDRLASPFYGGLVDRARARRLILEVNDS
jgi:hypothetical protein